MAKQNPKLVDVKEPNLYRQTFPYTEFPRVIFDNQTVEYDIPEKIWITDTTFRDGQQARPPYTRGQMVKIYQMLSRLGGPNGGTQRVIDGMLACTFYYPTCAAEGLDYAVKLARGEEMPADFVILKPAIITPENAKEWYEKVTISGP